jgi:hypothetical protein
LLTTLWDQLCLPQGGQFVFKQAAITVRTLFLEEEATETSICEIRNQPRPLSSDIEHKSNSSMFPDLLMGLNVTISDLMLS